MRIVVGHEVQQPVQLERIDAQAGRQAAEHAVAIVLDEIFGERFAGFGQMRLGPAIGAARPIGRIEQFAERRHCLDACKGVRCPDQTYDLHASRAVGKQGAHLLDLAFGGAADPGNDVHRIAQLLQNGVVRDGADLPQAHLAIGG